MGSRRASRSGVTAPIVAKKPGNSGGAKGCRKVETRCPNRWKTNRRQYPKGLNAPESSCAAGRGSKLVEDLISRSRDQIHGSRSPCLARRAPEAREMVRCGDEIFGSAARTWGVDRGDRTSRREDRACDGEAIKRRDSSWRAPRCRHSPVGAHPERTSASQRVRPVIRCTE